MGSEAGNRVHMRISQELLSGSLATASSRDVLQSGLGGGHLQFLASK